MKVNGKTMKKKMKKVASDYNGEEKNAEKTRIKKNKIKLKLDLSLVPTDVLDQLV